MDTCEPWTVSSPAAAQSPEDEWADFDSFAAQRVSQTSDTVMKDSTHVDPVEPPPVSPSNPLPVQEEEEAEVKNMEQEIVEK